MSELNIVQRVQDALDIYVSRRVIGRSVLDKVPALIDRAVIRLKRKDLIPPRVWEFKAGDYKEEKRDTSGKFLYNYIKLPDDFRKLDELFVGDNEIPYVWSRHENYLERISKFRTGEFRRISESSSPDGESQVPEFYPYRKLFTIQDINFSDIDKNQKVLLMYPFPKDDEYVKVSYHVSGSDLSYLDEGHVESIIREVEGILGLRSPQDSEDEVLDVIDEWRERKGHNSVNRTYHRTRGTFFGKWYNRHDGHKRRR